MKTLAQQRDRTEIQQRLTRLRPENAARWGRMSAHQMVCHLADAFRIAIGERPVRRAPNVFQRTVLKWLALYAPLPWVKGFPTMPEIDQVGGGGTRPAAFAADLAELERLLEAMTAPARALDGHAHPVFGSMSDAAWLRWGYLHVDHHLRQFGV
jgi:hypothetical protein